MANQIQKKREQIQKAQNQKTSRFAGFSWMKLVYTLIVVFLYVPLVFLGVQTFLPKYSDYDYPIQYKDCYAYTPYDEQSKCYDAEEQAKIIEQRDQCMAEQQAVTDKYNKEKREYETWKYLSVLGFAVFTLVLVMFIGFDVPIKIGLFIGSAAAVFIATMQYFETKSIPAFVVLLVVFGLVVYVIQKREKFFR